MKPLTTEKQIRNAPKGGPYAIGGKHGASGFAFKKDSDAAGAGSYIVRYRLDGARPTMGLGSASRITLEDASAAAKEAVRLAHKGVDPIAERERQKEEARAQRARLVTFAQETEAYLRAQKWKHRYAIASWRGPVARYAFPVIGHLRVDNDDIRSEHVAAIMAAAMAAARPPDDNAETAKRVRSRIDAVLNFAIRHGRRDATRRSPADAKLHTLKVVGNNFRRIDLDAAQETFGKLHEAAQRAEGLRAAELDGWVLAIAAAARPAEALYAQWSEFNLDKREWRIPAARTKKRRDHRVPLNAIALEVLKRRQAVRVGDGGDALVFSNASGRKLNYTQFALGPQRAGINAGTLHSWRSLFRDWAGVIGHIDGDLAELALAHLLEKTKRAYFRDDAFEPRRAVMAKYADWLNRAEAEIITFPTAAHG
jgi:integrase